MIKRDRTLHFVIQSLSCVPPFVTPSSTILWSLLRFMSAESVLSPSHLILYHPLLLLPSASSSFLELALCIEWPQYWTFSFSISPSNEYSGLISFRMDWFDLLAVQRTFKSLLQHHNSKALWSLHGSQPCHGQGACVTQWSYESCHAGPTEMTDHSEAFSQSVVNGSRTWQPTSVFLPWEHHKQYERDSKYQLPFSLVKNRRLAEISYSPI